MVKEYFRNYSDGSPKPAADAIAAFAPKVSKESAIIMRDLLHLGGNIKPNEKKGGVYANKPTISLQEIPTGMVEAVTIGGQRRNVRFDRDRNVFSNFRLDAIYDASKYAPNGLPIQVGVDRSKIFPLARSNFSPGKGTVSEVVGDTKIITDTDIGARIVVPKGKKAQLFMDGKLVGEYADELDAVLASNKKSAKQGVQVEPRQQTRQGELYSPINLEKSKAVKELTSLQKETNRLRNLSQKNRDIFIGKKRKEIEKIKENPDQFWTGEAPAMLDGLEAEAAAFEQTNQPTSAPPEVIEQISKSTKPKKELKSFSELTPIIEAVQEVKAEPKKVTNLLLPEVRRVRSEATTMYPEAELAAIPSVFEGVKARPKPAPEPVKPETTAPAPEVVTPKQDARIPQGFVIQRTPRGMFMVVLIAKNASVAVEKSYEKAVQKARKRQKTSRSY